MQLYLSIKRILDFVLSLIAIFTLWPVFLIIAIFLKLDSKGPVFFKQKRIGKNKDYFYILKFRTMKIDTPKDMPTHILHNPDLFITKIGRFLRKTSLDELPQIINILKGEMSIIGPRPALWNQYDLISEREQFHANDILPGLTGWAQINGRDELPISEKAKLDEYYRRNMNFVLDSKIFFLTIFSVLLADGVKEGASNDSKICRSDK
nr:sugar transferase [Paenibacillus foliorum]